VQIAYVCLVLIAFCVLFEHAQSLHQQRIAFASLAVSILALSPIELISVDGLCLFEIATSSQINAFTGVDLTTQCIAHRVSGCSHQTV